MKKNRGFKNHNWNRFQLDELLNPENKQSQENKAISFLMETHP